jgi:hypothetical protein
LESLQDEEQIHGGCRSLEGDGGPGSTRGQHTHTPDMLQLGRAEKSSGQGRLTRPDEPPASRFSLVRGVGCSRNTGVWWRGHVMSSVRPQLCIKLFAEE